MEAKVPEGSMAGLPTELLGVDRLVDDMGLALDGQAEGLDERRPDRYGDPQEEIVRCWSIAAITAIASHGVIVEEVESVCRPIDAIVGRRRVVEEPKEALSAWG